ncbi:DNA-processing protein DprA [Salinactinospora qingdaonensis]|uniref:Smf/DprA SLOG domain-containing protein n=1 Tax=Salinactinospora qingdaonensis TaxID=702744 RepID=A0ABP7EWN7_9ACTN
MQQIDERTAMVALLLREGSRWRTITETVMEAGSAVTVLQRQPAPQEALFSAAEPPTEVTAAHDLLADCEKRGVRVLSFLDEEYPARLREIHEMPPIVFTWGELRSDAHAIAVVGSRKASQRGLEIAENIAGMLASRGITVVSGLALGIDTAAHTAALAHGGRTVAVLGTGINRCYPKQNRELHETIARRGMLLSQFLPDAPPSKRSFPMRNAVMSGYATATVVVEAGEHSGARIQARFALQHGRPVIFPRELLVNEWARRYAEFPGVHVVDSLDQLAATVDALIREAELTPEDLHEAVDIAW